MPSAYQQFIKDNYHKCSGTPTERMKQCASMYREHKAKGGVLSGAGMKAMKPKKQDLGNPARKQSSKGGLLSAAGLEEDMGKLKIFKEHMASKPKAGKSKGGLLSGAGLANEADNEDSSKFYRQGTGIGF